jgi:hypothetical protein
VENPARAGTPGEVGSMPEIFIGYRRSDGAAYAGRIYDRLRRHYGESAVFMDIQEIQPGERFRQVIEDNIRAARIFIALIGPNWLGARGADGTRRLDSREDLVGRELALALSLGKRVIPVTVGGADLPDRNQLPEPLQSLVEYNAFDMRDRTFEADMRELVGAIDRALGRSRWGWLSWRKPWLWLTLAAAAAGAGVFVIPHIHSGHEPGHLTPSPAVSPSPPTATRPWFGSLPPNIIGIAATQFDQFATEMTRGGKFYGLFSYCFLVALSDPESDRDGDGKISLREATDAAAKGMRENGSEQRPTYQGPSRPEVNLFSTVALAPGDQPRHKVYALLIGVSEYRFTEFRLGGPGNDVAKFTQLLAEKDRLLASEAEVTAITNQQATQADIWEKLKWLFERTGPDDVILFFFSGNTSAVTEETGDQKRAVKVFFPYDAVEPGKIFIKVGDVADYLGHSRARQVVLIFDG